MTQIYQINQTNVVGGDITMYIHGVISKNKLLISAFNKGNLEVWKQPVNVTVKESSKLAFISNEFVLDLDRYNNIVSSYQNIKTKNKINK